jgi:hypothetical protein
MRSPASKPSPVSSALGVWRIGQGSTPFWDSPQPQPLVLADLVAKESYAGHRLIYGESVQHKRRRILRSLAVRGGYGSPGQLYAELGIAPRTGSRTLGRLRALGLIEGTKRRLALTEAGWEEAERSWGRRLARPGAGAWVRPTRRPGELAVTARTKGEAGSVGQTTQVSDRGLSTSPQPLGGLALVLANLLPLLEARRDCVEEMQMAETSASAGASPLSTPEPSVRAGGWVVLPTGQVVWRETSSA